MRKALWWPLGVLATVLLVLALACSPAATPTPSPTPSPTVAPTFTPTPTNTPSPTPIGGATATPPPGAFVLPVDKQVASEGITVGVTELWLTDRETVVQYAVDCGPHEALESFGGTSRLVVDKGPVLVVFEGGGGMGTDPSQPLEVGQGTVLGGTGSGGGCRLSDKKHATFPPLPGGAQEITFSYGIFLGADTRDLTLELPIGQYLSKLSPKYGGETDMDLVVESDGLAYRFTKLTTDPDSLTLTYEPANDPARWQRLSGPPGVETSLEDDKGNEFRIGGAGGSMDGKNDFALKEGTVSFHGNVDLTASTWTLTVSKLGKVFRGPWQFTVDVSAYTGGLPLATATPTPTKVKPPTPTPIVLVKPFNWPSRLKDALAMTPAEFADRPLEFADYLGAAKSMGLDDYHGAATFRQDIRPVLEGPFGGLPNHDGLYGYSNVVYDKAGLDLMAFELAVWADDTGKGAGSTFLAGEQAFGKETVWSKLTGLGYKQAEYEDVPYLWYSETTPVDLIKHPLRRIGISMDRVGAPGDDLLLAPTQDMLQMLVDVRQGKAKSLADGTLHAALANAVGDGLLGASIMPEAWLMEQTIQRRAWAKQGGEAAPLVQYLEGSDKWGTLSPYSLALLGYGYTGEAEELVVALAYPDAGMAAKDAPELTRRWNTYEFGGAPVKDSCAPLTTRVVSGPDYSVLVGSCPTMRDRARPTSTGPATWVNIVMMGQLHLLAPDLEAFEQAVREKMG